MDTSHEHSSPTSITDVAALAEVSTATVSRVLSGRRKKDDEIARRVRKAARTLHYSVNYAASSLRSDLSHSIGVVIPSTSDPLAATLLDIFARKSKKDHIQLLIDVAPDYDEQQRSIQLLQARNPDGIIIISSQTTPISPVTGNRQQSTFLETNHANTTMRNPQPRIVQIGGRRQPNASSLVSPDSTVAMSMAVDYIANQGASSVAYFAGPIVSFETAELFALFSTLLRARGLTTNTKWNSFGDCSLYRGFASTLALFEHNNAPQAIVCENENIAWGVYEALRTHSRSVPIIALDSVPHSAYSASTNTDAMHFAVLTPAYESLADEALRLLKSQHSFQATVLIPPIIEYR